MYKDQAKMAKGKPLQLKSQKDQEEGLHTMVAHNYKQALLYLFS